MNDDLALAIRLARIAVGKTQGEVAREIGVNRVMLNYFERGRRKPKRETVLSIFDKLQRHTPKSYLAGLVLREARRTAESALA